MPTAQLDLNSKETAFNRMLEPERQAPMRFSKDPSAARVSSSTKVEETEDYYLLTIEATGLHPENFEVEASERKVTLRGEWIQAPEKGAEAGKKAFGNFRRTFSPATRIDARNVEAQYKAGELKVYVPKSKESEVIPVKVKDSFSGDVFKRPATKGFSHQSTAADPHANTWAA